jgi:hypothetical protein
MRFAKVGIVLSGVHLVPFSVLFSPIEPIPRNHQSGVRYAVITQLQKKAKVRRAIASTDDGSRLIFSRWRLKNSRDG